MYDYSFDEALRLDQSLHSLALYEVTKGMIVVPKTQEEYIDLQDKIADKFNYFKGLIQRNECTFQYIKKDVLQRNGPFPKSDPVDFEKIEPREVDDVDNMGNLGNLDEKDIYSFTKKIVDALLPPKDDNDLMDQLGLRVTVKPASVLPAPKPDKPKRKKGRKNNRNKKN